MTNNETVTGILFPQTYLSEKGWQKLSPYFERISIYQPDEYHIPPPVQELSDKGRLEIRIPIKEKQEELRSIRKAFLQWADIQGENLGPAAVFARFAASTPGVVPADPVLGIRNQILQISQGEISEEPKDPFLRSRLFLLMAQDFDLSRENIDSELAHLQEMEAAMQDALAGSRERNLLAENPVGISGRGEIRDFMALDRLNAWIPMLQQDYKKSGQGLLPAVFVTSSCEIIKMILEEAPDCIRIATLDDIAVPMNTGEKQACGAIGASLYAIAKNTAKQPFPGVCMNNRGDSQTLFAAPFFLIIPEMRPLTFFLRFSRVSLDPEIPQASAAREIRHTIIGFLP